MKSFCPKNGISRRNFLKGMFLAGTGLFTGSCSSLRVPSDLRSVAKGYRPYNGINPHAGRKQIQTFLDNIIEHKAAWAGAQYSKDLDEPIVSSARGKLLWIRTKRGYHGLENDIRISHGGGISTRYFHMKPYSCNLSYGQIVERGDVIGHTLRGMPFKTSMSYNGILGDMDDYGHNMSYMEYWDGTHIDHTFDEVCERSIRHVRLIGDLGRKYIGPGLANFEIPNQSIGVPFALSHDSAGFYLWSPAMFFKLLKQIYDNQPELYSGTRPENETLIREIYSTQPVTLTLMFKH